MIATPEWCFTETLELLRSTYPLACVRLGGEPGPDGWMQPLSGVLCFFIFTFITVLIIRRLHYRVIDEGRIQMFAVGRALLIPIHMKISTIKNPIQWDGGGGIRLPTTGVPSGPNPGATPSPFGLQPFSDLASHQTRPAHFPIGEALVPLSIR